MDSPKFYSLLIILFTLISTTVELQNGHGFTTDLIYRDSPESPLYDENQSDGERFQNAVTRSRNRIRHFSTSHNDTMFSSLSESSPQDIAVNITVQDFAYLMRFSIGTPPFAILAAIDTGSSMIWVQCKQCFDCYEQVDERFDPTNSSSYKNLECNVDLCQIMGGQVCGDYDGDEYNLNICQYSTSYADGSTSTGILASDLFTLELPSSAPFTLPDTIFGCGFINKGIFSKHIGGIVGLGYDPNSLVSQLGHLIQKTFSYCLVPSGYSLPNSGKIHFGADGVVSGEGVLTTPMVKNQIGKHYAVEIGAITIGYEKFEFDVGKVDETTIVVDSGTPLTYLPRDIYKKMEASLRMQMVEEEPCPRPRGSTPCYDLTPGSLFPEITMHFTGADVKLNRYNAFHYYNGCLCFAFKPVTDHLNILGSIAQANFLVGFDLEKETVSFKPYCL